MRSDLENMVQAAWKSCELALGAIGELTGGIQSLPPQKSRGLTYTALERLRVTREIVIAIDSSLDMEERGHGTLRS
jgi:hypothetical protein